MEMLITITGKSGAENQSCYTARDLRRMAKAAVGTQGKLLGFVVNVNELNGRTRLIASYETAPNQQTFTTVAI
jgi:hypothetical protein